MMPTVNLCSFCGKRQDEVRKLIAGARVVPPTFICNECVDLCAEIIEREDEQREPGHVVLRDWADIEVDGEKYRWMALRTPVSTKGEGRRPMVMISVEARDGKSFAMLHPDGTEPTAALALEAIRMLRSSA